jgi:DNA replicative helicase MCM subunit Mcm2 (Cdc46/Mcm family)
MQLAFTLLPQLTLAEPTHNYLNSQIASLYAELRRQSAISGGVPIAVRHIESVMRMAEASARMHLRDHVRDDDVDLAIKVCLCPIYLQSNESLSVISLWRNHK